MLEELLSRPPRGKRVKEVVKQFERNAQLQPAPSSAVPKAAAKKAAAKKAAAKNEAASKKAAAKFSSVRKPIPKIRT